MVTGGTGYIGSHTVVELHAAGYEVVVIDNLSNSNIEVLDGIEKISGKRPVFVEGDCTDINTLRRLFEENPGINAIINFAASKAVGESVQKPLLYYRNNLNTLTNLLELMPEFGVMFKFNADYNNVTWYGMGPEETYVEEPEEGEEEKPTPKPRRS